MIEVAVMRIKRLNEWNTTLTFINSIGWFYETFLPLNSQNYNNEILNKIKYENKMRNVVKQNVLSLNKVYIAFVDHKVFISHTHCSLQ